MSRPAVSIITICKNSAATIAETMESILGQQLNDLEYIIIDGGSTDGTQDIVRAFGYRVSIFVSEGDKGISDAFNKGIARASGNIIGLINADDRLLPGTLGKVVEFFENNQAIDVMHGDVLFYDGDYFVKRIQPPAHWWLPWRMGAFNIHPATFVRGHLYQKHGHFDTSYKYAMDDDLFMRWLTAGAAIAYLPEPLVRVSAGGVSGRHAFKVFKEKRRALLGNGFQRIPTEIQFICRFIGQLVVLLQQMWINLKKKNKS